METPKLPIIAIIGRPNVGKSTLFNRLAGKRLAIVDDQPGVTRDRRYAPARLYNLNFQIIDTAGLEEAGPNALESRMRLQTEKAVAEADIVLFVIDGRTGLTPLDENFARWLRPKAKHVILLANKVEGKAQLHDAQEAYRLGFGEPILFSAAHGLGQEELHEALAPLLNQPAEVEIESEVDDDNPIDWEDRPIHIAIVGRPNVGKSTLVNALLDEDRMLTGPEAGLTRDSISSDFTAEDKNGKTRQLRIVDTAGLRRAARISDPLEKSSVYETQRAIRLAHVVVLVIDATQTLDKQELTIARQVEEEGRALILAVNKWDQVESRAHTLKTIKEKLGVALTQLDGMPVITLSALRAKGLPDLLDAVFATYALWNKRIPTRGLNLWLEDATTRNPTPAVEGRRIRLRYATQLKSRPPTFAIWVSKPLDLPTSYLRYLTNSLRETFDFPGIPIRWILKKGNNPYVESE